MDLDLRDLTDVSAVLSSVDAPAGWYTKVRLSISDPRLVLTEDPETVITDIQLTAADRLFISKQFEIPPEPTLLLLNFGRLHLVPTGGNGYVLTPQLDVTIDIQDATVALTGEITAVDTDSITLALEQGAVDVLTTGADVFLPGDVETPTGTLDDLTAGITVDITGVTDINGTITADTITITAAE